MASRKSTAAVKTAGSETSGRLRAGRGRLRWLRWRSWPGQIILTVVTAVSLNLAFPPADAWPLAYVALVPWLLALAGCSTRTRALVLSAIGGVVFWVIALHWLSWITPLGYGGTVVGLTLLWLVAGVTFRSSIRRGWPNWIVVPVVWVALEYARAWYLSGMPWFFLAHTQYRRVELIQIVDLTGVYGVSFFVALGNGLALDWLLGRLAPHERHRRDTRRSESASSPRSARAVWAMSMRWIGLGLFVLTGSALVSYGNWRLAQADRTTTPGPRIGLVQRAYPIALGRRSATGEEIFQAHVDASRLIPADLCDLLVWPETMLPRGLNSGFLRTDPNDLQGDRLKGLAATFFGDDAWGVDDEPYLRELIRLLQHGRPEGDQSSRVPPSRKPALWDQARALGKLSEELTCPLLAGGASIRPNPQPVEPRDQYLVYNAALWFDGSPLSQAEYAKMHLVPFSEYVPFKRDWLTLHRGLRWFVPSSMEQLEPGRVEPPFVLESGGETYNLVAPICYEGTFARVCRQLAMQTGRKPENLILVNLSNDGWFVHDFADGPHRGTTEHAQHLAHYCFRAIELRVPVVRAVNTGISASIDSSGRVLATIGDGKPMAEGVLLLAGRDKSGAFTSGPRVLVDSRTSLYSLAGDVFAQIVSAGAALLLGWVVFGRRQGQRRRGLGRKTRNSADR